MTRPDSPYYPRRANLFSPLLAWGDALHRLWDRSGLLLADKVTVRGVIASVFVPGLALYLRGPRASGRAAMGVCALLFLFFMAFLGYPLGTLALALLMSIHVTGVVAYYQPVVASARLSFRLMATLMLCALTIGFVYLPARDLLENRWLMPLQVKGQVVVIHRLTSPVTLRRGDWIAFRNGSIGGDHMYIRSGVNFAPVLALPGDQVEFSAEAFSVNGVAQPRRQNMPQSGGFTVDRNCWFAWPEFAIYAHGHAMDVSGMVMQMALVSKDELIGKPFDHWFWRRQSFQ
ncbi:MAG: hypothetical protein ABSH38_10960 [Verrucomicrobiota bacterium]|jgi:hypothetical protein